VRHIDITCPHSPPATHPYLVTLFLDPSDAHKFGRLFENEPAVKILAVDRSKSTTGGFLRLARAGRLKICSKAAGSKIRQPLPNLPGETIASRAALRY